MSVMSADRQAGLRQNNLLPTYTQTIPLFFFPQHTHSGLFRASMTAWSCDAESDKLISKSLWY